MKGVGRLYAAFKKNLRQSRKKIAPLQVISRLEEHLTKEFCSVILSESSMAILPLTSPGLRIDGRKIDIALVEGDLSGDLDKKSAKDNRSKLLIRSFVEVKYLRNRHRFGYSDATDEIDSTLSNLHQQLGTFDLDEYAGYGVHLRGRLKDIYGLILASHVRRSHERDDKQSFIRKVNKIARRHGLTYFDMQYPQLDLVYSDEPVSVLNARFCVSLFIGLWRLR